MEAQTWYVLRVGTRDETLLRSIYCQRTPSITSMISIEDIFAPATLSLSCPFL